MMKGVAENRFYILGGKDGGESIRAASKRRSDAILNDEAPPFGGGFANAKNKKKFDKIHGQGQREKGTKPKL